MVFASTDAALVLVSDRDVLVKVNLVADKASTAKPTGTLLVMDGAGRLLRELPLVAPTGAVPTAAPTRPSFADSFNVIVPADLVSSGLQFKAQFQPAAASEAVIAPRVGGGRKLTHVSIPIRIGQTEAVPPANSARELKLAMPVADFTQSNHAPYQSQLVTTMPANSSEWSAAYDKLLGEIDDLRIVENADAGKYYYGWIPKESLGLAGVGYVPGRAAIGFDYVQNPTLGLETMVHEVGHNLSLRHAPCGNPANPDPQYPYANAALGAGSRFIWGYNSLKKSFIDATDTDEHDVMSYCSGAWFSDYNYRAMQTYLTPADAFSVPPSADMNTAKTSGPQELLLVSGAITGNQGTFNPVKSFEGTTRAPDEGPYRLRVTTAQGPVLEYPFSAQQVDHRPGAERFALAIPNPGSIAAMEVTLNGRVLIRRASTAAASGAPGAQEKASVATLMFSESNGRLRVDWDASRYQFLTVTHVGTKRTALALDAQGGHLDLPLPGVPGGGQYEFGLSDGVNTVREMRTR